MRGESGTGVAQGRGLNHCRLKRHDGGGEALEILGVARCWSMDRSSDGGSRERNVEEWRSDTRAKLATRAEALRSCTIRKFEVSRDADKLAVDAGETLTTGAREGWRRCCWTTLKSFTHARSSNLESEGRCRWHRALQDLSHRQRVGASERVNDAQAANVGSVGWAAFLRSASHPSSRRRRSQ